MKKERPDLWTLRTYFSIGARGRAALWIITRPSRVACIKDILLRSCAGLN
jgi:hypothetical protein